MKKAIIGGIAMLILVAFCGTSALADTYGYGYGYGGKMSQWFEQSTYQTLECPEVNEDLRVYAPRKIPMLILGRTLLNAGVIQLNRGVQVQVFSDINSLYPAEQDVVIAMYLNGIIQGNGDGTFTPKNYITRAEMTALVYRTYLKVSGTSRYYNNTYSRGFIYSDLSGHWSETEVNAATVAGIVEGNGNGYFYPDTFVTIEESLKMVTRMCELLNLDLNALTEGIEATIDVKFYTRIGGGGNSYDYTISEGNSVKIYFDNLSSISGYNVAIRNIVSITQYSNYLLVRGINNGTVEITARDSRGRTETKVIRVGSGSGSGSDKRPYHELDEEDTGFTIDAR